MTNIDVDAIEAREKAATPGPWDGSGTMLHGNAVIARDVFIAENVPPSDAEFIASAREDVPALTHEVRHLRAALREIEVMVNGVREGVLIGGDPGAVGAVGLIAAGLRGILRRARLEATDD